MNTRTLKILAVIGISLPVVALLLPVLSVIGLALVALAVPLLVLLAPVVVMGGLYFAFGSRDKAAPPVAVASPIIATPALSA